MQAEPFSGVAMPLEVEAVAADPVETGEGRVKLFAEILRETGAVALNEAILGAVPLAEDIDGIVELRRPDGGQESGLQEVVDQLLEAAVTADLSAAERPLALMRPLGSRRFDMIRHWLSPVPGQKLTQPLDSMIVDARQHVGEPGLWIDIVELGRGDERVDRSRTPAALIGAGEGPISSAHGDSP